MDREPPSFKLGNRDSLYYMRQVAMYAMDHIDAAMTGILSPHVLPVEDLQKMLTHIEEALPSTMPTSFIRGHTPLLQIPMHSCFDHR